MLIVMLLDSLLTAVGTVGERVTDAMVLDKKVKFMSSLEGEFCFPKEIPPQYHASPLTAELAKRGYAPAVELGREAYRQIECHLPPRKR